MTVNRANMNRRIARWVIELENFHYTIQHRSGKLMSHVDALSRLPSVSISSIDDSTQVVSAIDPEDITFQLQVTQNRDSEVSILREKLENGSVDGFVLEDGLVYRSADGDKNLLYVPKEMETNVIRHAHEKIGHMGVTKCIEQIKMHYWFPNMKEKVNKFIQNCIRCIMYAVPPTSNHKTLHNIPKIPIPFDTLHIDHFGPLPSIISKRKYILAVVDAFTKYVKLYAVNSTSTKEVCACLEKYFEHYSRPRRIISDRGTCFTSLEFSSFLLEHNIDHVKVGTASAQANGQVERVNRIIKSMLAKISEPIQHSDWSKMLIKAEYALNNSVHSTTRQTPCMLLFGVNQRGREVDRLTEFLEENQEISRDLVSLREKAAEHIQTSQEKNLTYFQNKHKPAMRFEVDEYVVMKNVDTTLGTNKKFVPKY